MRLDFLQLHQQIEVQLLEQFQNLKMSKDQRLGQAQQKSRLASR